MGAAQAGCRAGPVSPILRLIRAFLGGMFSVWGPR